MFQVTASAYVLFAIIRGCTQDRKNTATPDCNVQLTSWRGCWVWRPAGVSFPMLCSFLWGWPPFFVCCVLLVSEWLQVADSCSGSFHFSCSSASPAVGGRAPWTIGSEGWLWGPELPEATAVQPVSWRKCGGGSGLSPGSLPFPLLLPMAYVLPWTHLLSILCFHVSTAGFVYKIGTLTGNGR